MHRIHRAVLLVVHLNDVYISHVSPQVFERMVCWTSDPNPPCIELVAWSIQCVVESIHREDACRVKVSSSIICANQGRGWLQQQFSSQHLTIASVQNVAVSCYCIDGLGNNIDQYATTLTFQSRNSSKSYEILSALVTMTVPSS